MFCPQSDIIFIILDSKQICLLPQWETLYILRLFTIQTSLQRLSDTKAVTSAEMLETQRELSPNSQAVLKFRFFSCQTCAILLRFRELRSKEGELFFQWKL